MENGISTQLAQAAISILAGAGLGLFYDLLRLPRLVFPGWLTTFLCDLGFCLGALLGLFTLGLGPGQGELRLFMLACVGVGWALWAAVPGRLLHSGEAALAQMLARGARKLAAGIQKWIPALKKVGLFSKKLFPSGARWFTIMENDTCRPSADGTSPSDNGRRRHRRRRKGDSHEVQTLRNPIENHRARSGGIRRDSAADAPVPDRRGPGTDGGTP